MLVKPGRGAGRTVDAAFVVAGLASDGTSVVPQPSFEQLSPFGPLDEIGLHQAVFLPDPGIVADASRLDTRIDREIGEHPAESIKNTLDLPGLLDSIEGGEVVKIFDSITKAFVAAITIEHIEIALAAEPKLPADKFER
jgi:hypothetical protein